MLQGGGSPCCLAAALDAGTASRMVASSPAHAPPAAARCIRCRTLKAQLQRRSNLKAGVLLACTWYEADACWLVVAAYGGDEPSGPIAGMLLATSCSGPLAARHCGLNAGQAASKRPFVTRPDCRLLHDAISHLLKQQCGPPRSPSHRTAATAFARIALAGGRVTECHR